MSFEPVYRPNHEEDSSGGQADGGTERENIHEPGQHLLELHGDD
jgi:hypothetical protein